MIADVCRDPIFRCTLAARTLAARILAARTLAARTLAVTTPRIYIPTGLALGLGFSELYPYVAEPCWVPNILLAQLVVRQARGAADC